MEALLLAKTVDRPQDPTFGTVKVAPTHTLPASVVRSDPFLKPQSSLVTDRPAADSPTTDPSQHMSTKVPSSSQPEPAAAHTSQRQLSSAFDTSRKETSSPSDSDADSLSSDRPALDIFPEEGELSEDQEANLSDHDQSLSEEQSYRETMRGIRR